MMHRMIVWAHYLLLQCMKKLNNLFTEKVCVCFCACGGVSLHFGTVILVVNHFCVDTFYSARRSHVPEKCVFAYAAF